MPFSTSRNPNAIDAIGSIAKIFVPDPATEDAYKSMQIKNETEFLKQKQIAEQTVSEMSRRKSLEASAAASNADAMKKQQNIAALKDLSAIFKQDYRTFDTPGGMSKPGDAPVGTPGAGMTLDKIAPDLLSNVFAAGVDAKDLSALALLPGASDQDLSRIMLSSGKPLGKDDYVSLEDRGANRRFELGANERLSNEQGDVMLPLDPNYVDTLTALANQRNAAAVKEKQGGKTPRLPEADLTNLMASALNARGANISKDSDYQFPDQFLAGQPEIYDDMTRIVGEAWKQSGGNTAEVLSILGEYLGKNDFSNFNEDPWFGSPRTNKIERPDANAILNNYLQSRQNVGNVVPPTPGKNGWGNVTRVDSGK